MLPHFHSIWSWMHWCLYLRLSDKFISWIFKFRQVINHICIQVFDKSPIWYSVIVYQISSSRLWEECSQEEARIVAWEEKMGNEDQTPTTHTKKIKRGHYHHTKGKHHHQNKKDNPRRSSRDLSSIRCYTCDEKGHIAKNCPRKKVSLKRRRTTKEDIILTLQRMMKLLGRESKKKVKILQVKKSMFLFLPLRGLLLMEEMIGS